MTRRRSRTNEGIGNEDVPDINVLQMLPVHVDVHTMSAATHRLAAVGEEQIGAPIPSGADMDRWRRTVWSAARL